MAVASAGHTDTRASTLAASSVNNAGSQPAPSSCTHPPPAQDAKDDVKVCVVYADAQWRCVWRWRTWMTVNHSRCWDASSAACGSGILDSAVNLACADMSCTMTRPTSASTGEVTKNVQGALKTHLEAVLAVLVPRGPVGAVRQQVVDDVPVAMRRRGVQGGRAAAVPTVHVGAFVGQELCCLQMALGSRPVQRRVPWWEGREVSERPHYDAGQSSSSHRFRLPR